MLLHEEETGDHFDYVLIHDAEDLVHPEALLWINYYAQWNEMVQIPRTGVADRTARADAWGVLRRVCRIPI